MAEKLGHIQLDGVHYRIQLDSYNSRDVSDYSPRASTPGGGVVFSDMALYQPIAQEDWRHGFGFLWHTDSSGFYDTEGSVDTRFPGVAMPFTRSDYLDATYNAGTTDGGFVLSRDGVHVIIWATTNTLTLYNLNTQAFTDVNIPEGRLCQGIWTNGTYDFILRDADRPLRVSSWSPFTYAETGINSNATDFRWMTAHDGFVYASPEGTNEVYFASALDLSDLHGDPADDPNVIIVGTRGRPVKGAISYNGDLYFARDDGLFRMDKDRTAARKVLDYSDKSLFLNFKAMAVYNGNLVFAIGNQLYQWNGVRVSPITPQRTGTTHPYTYYWYFSHLVVSGNFLFAIARRTFYDSSGASAQETDLLCFDGVGWHCLVKKLGGSEFTGTVGIPIIAFNLVVSDSYTPMLMYQVRQSYGTGANAGVYRIYLDRGSDQSYPAFTTGTTTPNALITSRFDAGFRRVTKSTPSILVEASNLSEDSGYERHLLIYYKTDTVDTWEPWGGTDGVTNKITYNGVTELIDPDGVSSTLEYKWLQLRVVYVTDIFTQAPILENVIVRVLLRPDTMYGYSFTVVGASEADYAIGASSLSSPHTILTALRGLRDSKAPISYVDPFGQSFQVYVTAITENAIEDHAIDMGPTPDIEHAIQVNLIDVDTYATKAGRA